MNAYSTRDRWLDTANHGETIAEEASRAWDAMAAAATRFDGSYEAASDRFNNLQRERARG